MSAPAFPGGGWTLRSHAAVVSAAHDPESFSSAVSRHLQIPNGLDGEEHAIWRPFIDQWFTPDRMRVLAPRLEDVARDLVSALPAGIEFDAVRDLGVPFAVRATCTWLGWPAAMEEALVSWMARNQAATRSGDQTRTAAVAAEFDDLIRGVLDHRADERHGQGEEDVTAELARSTRDGRRLEHAELVSILRNWTAGDLSSVALCVGVVVRAMADQPQVQHEVRSRVDDDAALDRAIDELLRIDDPFVANRRRTTREVDITGTIVPEGERVLLSWRDANRDPEVFGAADDFAPERNAAHNVVYGTGPHVCPGRPLAALELRVLVRALVTAHARIRPAAEPVRSEPPLGGWSSAPVVLQGL